MVYEIERIGYLVIEKILTVRMSIKSKAREPFVIHRILRITRITCIIVFAGATANGKITQKATHFISSIGVS